MKLHNLNTAYKLFDEYKIKLTYYNIIKSGGYVEVTVDGFDQGSKVREAIKPLLLSTLKEQMYEIKNKLIDLGVDDDSFGD